MGLLDGATGMSCLQLQDQDLQSTAGRDLYDACVDLMLKGKLFLNKMPRICCSILSGTSKEIWNPYGTVPMQSWPRSWCIAPQVCRDRALFAWRI